MISIDYQDRRPIYEQIVARYEMLILTGVLQEDEQLPSVRQMAQELSINPNTIQKAYSILEHDGYIYTVRGRGNFVSGSGSLMKNRRREWEDRLRDLLQEGKKLGIGRAACEKILGGIYENEGEEENAV
ncbi:MAG TPA: GntR family transcriptional regulator [Lachnospiraceae bacterium]|nr:GntR family transcriptional regulator [Lachnospiraceae bacterium]